MEIKKLPFEEILQFSKRDQAYQMHPEHFAEFIEAIPSLDNLKNKIKSRIQFSINRSTLVNHLHVQYEELVQSTLVTQNIKSLLDENTFTITTAHQPCLFTGPLYYVFKILSTIRLTEELNKSFPKYRFIPCFISGGEDHDYEEINHTQVFGKQITWHSTESGSCGRFSLDGLEVAISELEKVLGSSTNAQELMAWIKQSHVNSNTYGEFTLNFINHLFGDMGLVVLNMDNPALKGLFKDIIKREITESFSAPLVNSQIEKLKALGYKAQATPREINFFYLGKNTRNRIVLHEEVYKVLDTNITFNKEQLLAEMDKHPERFSPNVITRALYQERILPNLAYIGGGGEIAYWLERKTQFAKAEISFPILIRRNSAGIIDAKKINIWKNLGFNTAQISLESNQLKKQFALISNELPISVTKGKKEAEEIFETMAKEISVIDASIGKTVLAEAQKNKKSFDYIEGKLLKYYKQKEDINLKRIDKVQNYLFPNGNLQERKANFMEFYLREGKTMFSEMKEHLNPLETEFTLFIMD